MTDTPVPNTEEQNADHRAREVAWEQERTWPLWNVVILGDETTWVARPGVNVATEETEFEGVKYQIGDPMPWNAPMKAEVTLRAKNKSHAGALALAPNAANGYHTVDSVEKVKED